MFQLLRREHLIKVRVISIYNFIVSCEVHISIVSTSITNTLVGTIYIPQLLDCMDCFFRLVTLTKMLTLHAISSIGTRRVCGAGVLSKEEEQVDGGEDR